MRLIRVSAACLALALSLSSFGAQAQSQRRTATAAPSAPPVQNCLKALDGSCTDPDLVEAARLRAVVLSTERVSYWGTPAGAIGGPFIPFERLFQDGPFDELLFGLPTSTCTACVTRRTK